MKAEAGCEHSIKLNANVGLLTGVEPLFDFGWERTLGGRSGGHARGRRRGRGRSGGRNRRGLYDDVRVIGALVGEDPIWWDGLLDSTVKGHIHLDGERWEA